MRRLMVVVLAMCLTCAAATAWGYWSAGSGPGGNGAAAATSVNQGPTPTTSTTGQAVTVNWAASTLANGQPVSGYLIKRYDAGTSVPQTISSACTGTITATTCTENNVPAGSWKYTVTPLIGANWRGAEGTKSATVTIDATPPINAVALSSISRGAYKNNNTVYYRGSSAGSFRLTNTVTDTGSGPASSTTAALSGTSTGWAHTPSTVSTPSGGPYVSDQFAWAAGTTSTPGQTVVGRDVAGNSTATALSLVNDSTAPSAGSITYTNGATTGRSISVAFTTGTDTGAGVATRQLQRAVAPLRNGTCGTFSAFTNIGAAAPTSPYVDTQLANSTCYQYRYVVTDQVDNQHITTSTSVARVDYAAAVGATSGLLSFWRLGESGLAVISSDTFTGTTGATLQSRNGEIGASWTNRPPSNANATLTDAGRLRKAGTSSAAALYSSSGAPPSANYAVEGDMVIRSAVADDAVGVVGRLNTASSTGTYYVARYERAPGAWILYSVVNGSYTYINGYTQSLAVGSTYRLSLDMNGSTIRVLIDGVQRITTTSTTITAAGRGGVLMGFPGGGGTTITDTTGMHLDNYQVTPLPRTRAADSKGINTGDYNNGTILGTPGALGDDPNTAALFDGVNDYVQATGTSGIPVGAASRSVEMWFKTTSSSRQVLFGYGSLASTQQFGLWLNSGGASMTAWGYGTGNDKVFTLNTAVNDGSWHHIVKTYNGTTITLYIDGVALPAQAATRNTAMNAYGFSIGAITTPGDANSGGYFNGTLDDVSLYTTALNQTTVTDHYQLGTAR